MGRPVGRPEIPRTVRSPQGERTGIDVYGEFTSPTLPPEEVEAVAREFLATEFEADAPVIRAQYLKSRSNRS